MFFFIIQASIQVEWNNFFIYQIAPFIKYSCQHPSFFHQIIPWSNQFLHSSVSSIVLAFLLPLLIFKNISQGLFGIFELSVMCKISEWTFWLKRDLFTKGWMPSWSFLAHLLDLCFVFFSCVTEAQSQTWPRECWKEESGWTKPSSHISYTEHSW